MRISRLSSDRIDSVRTENAVIREGDGGFESTDGRGVGMTVTQHEVPRTTG
jgi:hypothetical protein